MFNERLKEIRKSTKKTQKEVSMYLGIAERAYQNYEYGNREPNLDTLKKLADYFNVSTDYLLGCSDKPTRY